MLQKNYILILVALCASVSLSATTWFVKASMDSGDGTNWDNSFSTLSEALAVAKAGDQVWVAGGQYFPSATGDRTTTFAIPDGIKLFGGFSGVELSLKERRISSNPTILDGSNGTPSQDDDAYSVVTIKNASSSTIIDGFFIQGGRANADLAPAHPHRCGGGLYNFVTGNGKRSNPILRNLVFRDNVARDGAGVYNHADKGEASPVFEKVEFQNNISDLDGGALYNDARSGGVCNPAFVECYFINNMATYGAAIFTATGVTGPQIQLDTCTFNNNVAYLRGGALFSLEGEKETDIEINNTEFRDNYPTDSDTLISHDQHASKMTFSSN